MQTGDHPLSASHAELTIEELDQKYNTLMGRWNAARRMNMDQGVMHQLDLLIGSIEQEREKRRMAEDRTIGVVLDTDPIVISHKNARR